jgi:hypothetical protein
LENASLAVTPVAKGRRTARRVSSDDTDTAEDRNELSQFDEVPVITTSTLPKVSLVLTFRLVINFLSHLFISITLYFLRVAILLLYSVKSIDRP